MWGEEGLGPGPSGRLKGGSVPAGGHGTGFVLTLPLLCEDNV